MMNRTLTDIHLIIKGLALIGVLSWQGAEAASIAGIGLLPDGTQSSANTISATGKYVGGDAATGNETHAVLWNAKSRKLSDLGTLADYTFASILAVSKNGKALAGLATTDTGVVQAFRWTRSKGIQGLGFLPGDKSFSRAQLISPDGAVILGAAVSPAGSAPGLHVFMWTAKKGMVDFNERYGIQQPFFPYGATSDMKVLVGYTTDAGNNSSAVRWTRKSGLVDLGSVPNSVGSIGEGVSANGQVTVGYCAISKTPTKFQACRWEGTGSAQALGYVPGYDSSMLLSANRDGSVAVGQALTIDTETRSIRLEAVIWDKAHGLRKLQDALAEDYGLAATGWVLNTASSISADGKTIVGTGKNPSGRKEGWVVKTKD